jgi:hypothetical protein
MLSNTSLSGSCSVTVTHAFSLSCEKKVIKYKIRQHFKDVGTAMYYHSRSLPLKIMAVILYEVSGVDQYISKDHTEPAGS